MMRKLGLAVLLFVMASVAAMAADFNGKWAADVPGRNGTQPVTFDLHVNGSVLTGKVTTSRGDSDISDGKVDGDTITFTQTMTMNGNEIKMTYTGKAEGDTIKFSRQAGDRPPTEFVAKKAM
jgi:hypothetical protein